MALERLLPRRAVPPVVVDQQVVGDRHQPGTGAGSSGIESVPGTQGALEGELGQVLGVVAGGDPVAEEPIDPPNVLLVKLGDLLPCGASGSLAASGGGRGAAPCTLARSAHRRERSPSRIPPPPVSPGPVTAVDTRRSPRVADVKSGLLT